MIRKALQVFTWLFIVNTLFAQKERLLTPKEFKETIEQKGDVQLVDVRTKREFDDGKIKGARLIDYYKPNFRALMSKLDKEKPIAVYCTVGGRSGAAARMLTQLGFKEVYDLRGGIVDWQKSGLKLTKD